MITAVLLCILLTLLFGGVLLSRRRRHNEPPLDRGLIPWLGHALEFGKDAATFLMSMKAKHGDIFTIQVAGKFLTVLLDPHSYENVVWASRSKLDFGIYAKVLMRRMFDVTLPDYDVTAEKAMLRPHLQNEKLCSLTASMRRNLTTILNDSSTSASAWREDSLFSFTYGVMLRAGFLTLFGSCELSDSPVEDLRHSKEVYREFRRFDKLLMKTARNALSAAEKKELCLVKENLWQLLDAETLKRRVNRSSWLESYQRHLEELQVPNAMQSRAMLLQLWATQGNAGPAAFWLLLYLMKHPRAMEAVTAELKLTMQGQEEISQRALESATILDSALEESLRMTAAPFITREVLSEGSLRLADGREYLLRRGDRLCLFPYVSPQMDTEIHPEPQEFRYNRFLNADGTKKREFYKSGRTLAHASLPWGAGSNVCVGRFYATNSIKLCIWLLLLNFEVGLKDPDEKMPEFDESRYGFGVLQPKHDVLFQYRRRRCELFMK
ncbi:prostacyclin synthase [Hyperolius riggenbachi]|uniref:prostacyclin synthase n=1 Tax=Hyperolius riggenbachi TaxID=752182 RepID=UPI0035A2DC7D